MLKLIYTLEFIATDRRSFCYSDNWKYRRNRACSKRYTVVFIRWPYRYSGAYRTPIFRWSIQFPWQLTFQLDTERFADMGPHMYRMLPVACVALVDATHAGARMNFDKTTRIFTEDRISARRRVWRRQFNEIQSGSRTGSGRFFFTHVVSPRPSTNEIDIVHEPMMDYWSCDVRREAIFINHTNWRHDWTDDLSWKIEYCEEYCILNAINKF